MGARNILSGEAFHMRPTTMEDFVPVEQGGSKVSASGLSFFGLTTASAALTLADGATAAMTSGSFTTEAYDVFVVALTAGTTYSFAERPTDTGGIEDPYLLLVGPDGHTLVAQDDDGGLGRSSLLTYTPTASGNYFLLPSSWFHVDPSAPGYPDFRDVGSYTISSWTASAATDAPATLAGAVEIGLGTTYGHLNVAGDKDMYKVQLDAGLFYNFTYAGGIASGAEYPNPVAGDNIGILRLYDANGVQISAAVNYETGLALIAPTRAQNATRARAWLGRIRVMLLALYSRSRKPAGICSQRRAECRERPAGL